MDSNNNNNSKNIFHSLNKSRRYSQFQQNQKSRELPSLGQVSPKNHSRVPTFKNVFDRRDFHSMESTRSNGAATAAQENGNSQSIPKRRQSNRQNHLLHDFGRFNHQQQMKFTKPTVTRKLSSRNNSLSITGAGNYSPKNDQASGIWYIPDIPQNKKNISKRPSFNQQNISILVLNKREIQNPCSITPNDRSRINLTEFEQRYNRAQTREAAQALPLDVSFVPLQTPAINVRSIRRYSRPTEEIQDAKESGMKVLSRKAPDSFYKRQKSRFKTPMPNINKTVIENHFGLSQAPNYNRSPIKIKTKFCHTSKLFTANMDNQTIRSQLDKFKLKILPNQTRFNDQFRHFNTNTTAKPSPKKQISQQKNVSKNIFSQINRSKLQQKLVAGYHEQNEVQSRNSNIFINSKSGSFQLQTQNANQDLIHVQEPPLSSPTSHTMTMNNSRCNTDPDDEDPRRSVVYLQFDPDNGNDITPESSSPTFKNASILDNLVNDESVYKKNPILNNLATAYKEDRAMTSSVYFRIK